MAICEWIRVASGPFNDVAVNDFYTHDSNRSGKEISLADLVKQLRAVYSLSRGCALLLAGAAIMLCGDMDEHTLSLGALARHGLLEHDYSLAHSDAARYSGTHIDQGHKSARRHAYSPTEVDATKLQRLLDVTKEEYLTAQDFAQARLDLAKDSGGESLSWPHFSMASGETCLILDVFGSDIPMRGDDGQVRMVRVVDKSVIQTWLGEDRLPDGYVKPKKKIRLSRLKEEFQEHTKLLQGIEHADAESSRRVLQVIIRVFWDALVSLQKIQWPGNCA